MIENCSGSVESSLSLTVVAKTRQKLSRQRARKRKRRVTSVETNEVLYNPLNSAGLGEFSFETM